jgi:hypothetical protein
MKKQINQENDSQQIEIKKIKTKFNKKKLNDYR